MWDTLRAIAATAGIIVLIGVMVSLIPVITAVITGVGILLLLGLVAGTIYLVIRDGPGK